MNWSLLTALPGPYQLLLSLYVYVGLNLATRLAGKLFMLIPSFRETAELNRQAAAKKKDVPSYVANLKWNAKWSPYIKVLNFGIILPFCLTLQPQPVWQMAIDLVAILLLFDLFYYLMHRFLCHDEGFMGGPPFLKTHGVHHQHHKPCRLDTAYLHPGESFISLELFLLAILLLSLAMGRFHVLTIIVSYMIFIETSQTNHTLFPHNRFPFKYLSFDSRLHHVHHTKFTAGNFGIISPLYDWMFGTLDHGGAPRRKAKA